MACGTSTGALRGVIGRDGEARIERMRYEPMRGEVNTVHDVFFHKRREYKEEREIRSVQVYDRPIRDHRGSTAFAG